LLVLSLSFLSVLNSYLASYPQIQKISTYTWAGYIITKQSDLQYEVIAINASWIVPDVNASAGDGYSSVWIGIGGQLDKTLIQVGTEQDVVSGQATYYVWYELLPSFSVRLNDIAVFPGDTMIASIILLNSDSNSWSLKINDETTGQDFSKNVVYNSTRSSSEWIVERPTIINQTSVLADFGSVTFTGCHINVSQIEGPIKNFEFTKTQMVNSKYAQLTSVSDLAGDGSSFTVSYLAGK